MTAQTILVAEDDDDDFFFTLRVLNQTVRARVMRVESGREVIDYLSGTGGYANRREFPLPDWLLLDLKMDDLDGHGVLGWLSQNPPAHRLTTFVLTGSDEQRDRERVRLTGAAAGYFVKPLKPPHIAQMQAQASEAQVHGRP